IAIGGAGSDVAMETADVIVMSSHLSMLTHAVGLSRATVRNMKQNIVFAILVAAMLGAGELTVILALSLVWWPGIARLARSLVLSLRSEMFVEAAVASGTPSHRIMIRHLLPNIIAPLIVRASIGVGFIIMAEATLSFLGIGVQEPTPTWGSMIRDGLPALRTDPYLALFASAALGITLVGFNLLGDGLRDILDPRTQER
ncbi:MAG: hypothetical protein CVT71_03050, partial [Alphaproteobacteria bacterium HGW-Alphaproteobacteria-10]